MLTSSRKPSGGFTLLEIVVAVAIFGVIASIIFPALLQFLEIRERVNGNQQQLQSLQKTFHFLANDLRYAANRLSKDEYGDKTKTTLLINDDVLLDFTALYPDVNLGGRNVPRRVKWQLVDNELKRIQYPVMDPDDDTRSMVQSLLTNVQEVDIQVSSVEDGRDNTDDKWEEQSRLPDLIDIVIELGNGAKYQRLFTMLGADTKAALKAISVAAPGAIGGNNQNNSGRNNPGQNSNPAGSNGSNQPQPQQDSSDGN